MPRSVFSMPLFSFTFYSTLFSLPTVHCAQKGGHYISNLIILLFSLIVSAVLWQIVKDLHTKTNTNSFSFFYFFAKVIYPKYNKYWQYNLASTIDFFTFHFYNLRTDSLLWKYQRILNFFRNFHQCPDSSKAPKQQIFLSLWHLTTIHVGLGFLWDFELVKTCSL